jgi:hypothetical protein
MAKGKHLLGQLAGNIQFASGVLGYGKTWERKTNKQNIHIK